MKRATALTLATVAMAIMGAIFAPADPAEFEVGAQQLDEARRLDREQRSEDGRAALVEVHLGAEQ